MSGAKAERLFILRLMMTYRVSSIGIAARNRMLMAGMYASALILRIEITKPSVREPLSPMKIEAGYQLKTKNAKSAVIKESEIMTIKKSLFTYPMVSSAERMIIPRVDAKPSIPSMRLKALVKLSTLKIVKGRANHPKEICSPKKVPSS